MNRFSQTTFLRLEDFEDAARRRLPRSIFGYVQGGSGDWTTLRDNRKVFSEIQFQPRVLVNVADRNTSVELFGVRYDAPFGIAPMAICALTGYRSDLALASAARRANIPMVVCSSALIRLEDVAGVAPDGWFQLYVPRHEEAVDALVDRVAGAGYRVLVVTVDTAIVPVREDNLRNGFKTPLEPDLKLAWDGLTHPRWLFGTLLKTMVLHGMPHFENNQAGRGAALVARNVARDFSGREHLDWSIVRRIRQRWRGPLVLKGILHPGDAKRAAQAGADGLIVSNHGGRQLDGTPSPMRVLPQIVEAAGPASVMIDSGFRRGGDVLKAIALGAKMAFIGRPFNYAAAVGGEAGVDHAIDLLRKEVRAGMALLGVNRLEALNPGYIYGVSDTSRTKGPDSDSTA